MVYYPLQSEYTAVGALGLILFALILIFAVLNLWKGTQQSNTTRLFYSSLGIMAILELPRYSEMVSHGTYNSKTTYSLHILSGSFFFVSFTIICYQWGSLLRIGTYLKLLYSRSGLFAVNIIFVVVDVTAMCLCITATSLDSFFRSRVFIGLTIIDAVKNCFYASILAYYGIKLIHKLWNYSQDERRHTSAVAEYCNMVRRNWCQHGGIWRDRVDSHESDASEPSQLPGEAQKHEAIFLGVVIRLTNVLLLCTTCFMLRVTMICLKIAALHSVATISRPNFALFGVAWTLCADFIPRVVPSLAFMHLMRSKRPKVTSSASPMLQMQKHAGTHNTTAGSREIDVGDDEEDDVEEGNKRGVEGARGRGGGGGGGSLEGAARIMRGREGEEVYIVHEETRPPRGLLMDNAASAEC